VNIKAVGFDVGNTLITYSVPLNWQALYPSAIKQVMAACGLDYSAQADAQAQAILTKYNTRVNYREHEVSSDTIFGEILDGWDMEICKLQVAKQAFYSYFQRQSACYDDAEHVLLSLKSRGIKLGVLTDVAYGMDNEYALQDLVAIRKYIDICLTSTDVGYRKPHKKGYLMLQEEFDTPSSTIAFVGDEEKDIVGANNVGFISILKSYVDRDWGQNHTIRDLSELLPLVDNL